MKQSLTIILTPLLKEGVQLKILDSRDDLTQFSQIIAEQYIKNSFYLASKYADQEKSEQILSNRKNDYLKYIIRTCKRIAIFTGNFDYSMQVMKQRAITVASQNNFLL